MARSIGTQIYRYSLVRTTHIAEAIAATRPYAQDPLIARKERSMEKLFRKEAAQRPQREKILATAQERLGTAQKTYDEKEDAFKAAECDLADLEYSIDQGDSYSPKNLETLRKRVERLHNREVAAKKSLESTYLTYRRAKRRMKEVEFAERQLNLINTTPPTDR
jgi:hypothetical protein